MAKRKPRGPKTDKYQAESDQAQAARKQLDKKHEPRQQELNRQQRGAALMADALSTQDTCKCGLMKWECELLGECRAGAFDTFILGTRSAQDHLIPFD